MRCASSKTTGKYVYYEYDSLPKGLHAAEFLQWNQKTSYSDPGPIQYNICVHVKSRLFVTSRAVRENAELLTTVAWRNKSSDNVPSHR